MSALQNLERNAYCLYIISQSTKLRATYVFVRVFIFNILLPLSGGDAQAALGTGGLTNSAGTTVHLLLTSGDIEPSCVDTLG